jgi:hypothetical protein
MRGYWELGKNQKSDINNQQSSIRPNDQSGLLGVDLRWMIEDF